MKLKNLTKVILLAFLVSLLFEIINPAYAQEYTLEQIKDTLLNNPPNTGNPIVREETILFLDNILKHDSSRTAPSVLNFYTSMMSKVKGEEDRKRQHEEDQN